MTECAFRSAAAADASLDANILDTKADDVHCESLRVSYIDPYGRTLIDSSGISTKVEERLTEDIFLDPRDSWCGEQGGLLFVTSNALTALQTGLDKQYAYFQGSQEVVDKCRHDYMRELQYLLEELHNMKKADPKARIAIDNLLDEIADQRAENQAAGGAAFDKSEAMSLAQSAGPREESDEELIVHLEAAGLTRDCELTLRLLLKNMHAGVDSILNERARLLQILGPMDSEAAKEKVLDALLAAAKDENASMSDLILAIQDHMRSDEERTAIEDVVSERLRSRYSSLEENYNSLVPKLANWRAQLAMSEEREARLFSMRQEQTECEEEVAAHEAHEAAKIAAWQIKNDPVAKKEKLMAAAASSTNMNEEDSAKMKAMEIAEAKCERDCAALAEEISQCESAIEGYDERKRQAGEGLPQLQKEVGWAERALKQAEARMKAAEGREKHLEKEEMQATKDREKLEDELHAASIPPPSKAGLFQLEADVEDAKARNADLRLQEEAVQAKEVMYKEKCAEAMKAWDARGGEAVELVVIKTEPVVEKKKRNYLLEDPLLLQYFERYKIPDVANQGRFLNLHTDTRAKERRLQKWQKEHLAVESEKIIASAEAVGVSGAASGAPKQAQACVPCVFRRPEDLRVRLAGSEITAGHVQQIYTEHQALTTQLNTNLRGITDQIGSYGAQSCRLHNEARSQLEEALQNCGTAEGTFTDSSFFLTSGGTDADVPENLLSRDLSQALQQHTVALEHAEQAWHQAEQICERRLGEAEVSASERSCAALERELTDATRVLYATAAQAAGDASCPLATPAQNCVLGFQAAEPQLAAAGAGRSALWPRVVDATERLQWERQVQDGLKSFLRDETQRRDLLSREVRAPNGEAKRALASMRLALASGNQPEQPVRPPSKDARPSTEAKREG